MKTLLYISLIPFAGFLVYFWFIFKHEYTGKAFGIQPSVSATYKLLRVALPKAARSIWLFLFFLLAVGILSAGGSAWYFGSAVGLMGVGSFPEYWEKDEVKKHVTAAYLAYLVPMVFMLFFSGHMVNSVLAGLWLCFAGILSSKKINLYYKTTLIELSGFIVIIVGLYIG